MHYYQFNIADYRKDTQHLSAIEHYIYRELMDWYYLDEQPIPRETQRVIRRLRLGSENNPEVKNVLEEFFKETDLGWVHGRIERELEVYRVKADTARANGSKGGRPKKPKKTQPVNYRNPEETQAKANHKPITNNQELNNKDSEADASLASHLLESVLRVAPKTKQPNLDAWANDIRLMRERDGNTLEEIRSVFDWANSDPFWSTNILSPSKLRSQFAKLHAEMTKPRKSVVSAPAGSTRGRTLHHDLTDTSWAN